MQMNEALEQLRSLYDAIPRKNFKESIKGYEKRDVDEYLDSICDVMANVIEAAEQQQNAPAPKVAMPVKPAAVAPAPAPAADGNVAEVLAMAVRLKNEIIEDAQQKAADIVAGAEKTAADRLSDLTTEQERLQKQVDSLKQAAADYRSKFEAMLDQQKKALADAADLF